MTNFNSKRPVSAITRVVVTLGCLLFLSTCGGGLGGSGDGGSSAGYVVPLPDTFAPPYQFDYVPERLLAEFPPSLAPAEFADKSSASPYDKLTGTISNLIDQKLEIGLLRLHLEANWSSIVEYCSVTPSDSDCTLSDAGISTLYTAEMASWEYLLRARTLVEKSGNLDTLTDDILTELEQLVTDKIGTPLPINIGSFKQASSGSFRYEIIVIADFGFGNISHGLRWSEDKSLTFLSLSEIQQTNFHNLQSSTDTQNPANGFNNAILLSSLDNGDRQDQQLNFNQPVSSQDLRIESQLTEIANSTKTDYYSIGSAGSEGGYLSSVQSSEDAKDVTVSDFVRESFTEDAVVETSSICRIGQSEEQCDTEGRWEIKTSADPVTSRFFLTPEQLTSLEARLKPFDLNIQGVDEELDTLVLIRRDNLHISISSEGIILKVPGLGTIDLTSNLILTEPEAITDNPELFSEYAASILCRVNRSVTNEHVGYRSFCAGTVAEIESALVIGESFREGQIEIEWQANAVVKVIENQ